MESRIVKLMKFWRILLIDLTFQFNNQNMKTKITIVIRGGTIQEVSSDSDNIETTIIDIDDLREQGLTESQIGDALAKSLHRYDVSLN